MPYLVINRKIDFYLVRHVTRAQPTKSTCKIIAFKQVICNLELTQLGRKRFEPGHCVAHLSRAPTHIEEMIILFLKSLKQD